MGEGGTGEIYFETSNIIVNNTSTNEIIFGKDTQVDTDVILQGNMGIDFDEIVEIDVGKTLSNEISGDNISFKKLVEGPSATIENKTNAEIDFQDQVNLGSLTASEIDNTILYSSNSSQNIIAGTYFRLELVNLGDKILNGDLFVLEKLRNNDNHVFDASAASIIEIGEILNMNNVNITTTNFIPPTKLVFNGNTYVGVINGNFTGTLPLNDLEIDKSGTTFSINKPMNIDGNLTIKSNTNFQDDDIVIQGTTVISNGATVTKSADGGILSFEGLVTVNAGCQLIYDLSGAGTSNWNFYSGIDNSGTVDIERAYFEVNNQSYLARSGSSNTLDILTVESPINLTFDNVATSQVTLHQVEVQTGGTLTNQSSAGLVFTQNPTGGGNIINDVNAVMRYEAGGTFFTSGTLDATANHNKFYYSFAGNQTINTSTNYDKLILSTSGTKFLTSDIISEDLTIEGDAILDATGTNTITLHDDFAIDGNGDMSTPPTTFIFSNDTGTNAELKGTTTNNIILNNIQVNKSGGQIFKNTLAIQITGDLSVQNGIYEIENNLIVDGQTNVNIGATLREVIITNTYNFQFKGQVIVDGQFTTNSASTIIFEDNVTSQSNGLINLRGPSSSTDPTSLIEFNTTDVRIQSIPALK